MSKTILEVKDVCLDYKSKSGTIHALEDINFEIGESEFVCVLGPSGCGKSTLLKLMMRISLILINIWICTGTDSLCRISNMNLM